MKWQSLLVGVFMFAPIMASADLKSDIMWCESQDNPAAINHLDSKITGYSSYGLYQFQPLTFLKFGIIYKVFPEGTTLKEAMKYILNPAYNAAVAHAMIDDGLTNHWLNCSKIVRGV